MVVVKYSLTKLADRIQPNPVAVENAIEQMEKLLTDLKELQKKGVQDIPYCDGFPNRFHTHLRFTKLCLEVLDENVSDVLLEQRR